MYFTNEEKEIITNIAKKDRYSINDFFIDNLPNRKPEKLSSDWNRFTLSEFWYFDGGKLGLRNIDMKQNSEIFIFENSYKTLVDKFVKIINILSNLNMIVSLKVDTQYVLNNFKNFGYIVKNEFDSGDIRLSFHIMDTWCKQYEKYCTIELLIIQSDLENFIHDGFQTKEEIERDEERKSRNEALRNAKKSFWVSVFLALLSVGVSVIPLFKDNKVIVKNQINTQQLESQLKQTNQELKDIKAKFKELEKQIQKPIKK